MTIPITSGRQQPVIHESKNYNLFDSKEVSLKKRKAELEAIGTRKTKSEKAELDAINKQLKQFSSQPPINFKKQ